MKKFLVLVALLISTTSAKAESYELPDKIINLIPNYQKMSLQEIAASYDQKYEISKQPLFLNVSGWFNKGLLVHKRVNLNQAFSRMPDKNELRSPSATFAVNFEYFIKDPEFKCRRPSYYQFYSDLFSFYPNSELKCEANNKITLISENGNSSPMATREIDPNRVYQIHYLFAGKGKEMMSRFGHAMFRIVICGKGKEVGPDCLQDYSEHIVVSYRANVEDMSIDYRKGMNGAYASQLFLMNMKDVIEEYTKGEFRDVTSLPINLDREQIKKFIDKLQENYWSYKGRYYFLTNNCATESINLLRVAFAKNHAIQTVNINTPIGIYKYLSKIQLINPELVNDRKKAKSQGYFFEGVSEKLNKSIALFIDTEKIKSDDFLLDLSTKERLAIYQSKLDTNDKKLSLLANALRIEEQIQMSREQKFAKLVGEALFGKKPIPELKDTELDENILEMRELYAKLSTDKLVSSGYGIPLKSEYKEINSEEFKSILAKIESSLSELKILALNFFPKEVDEMKQIAENRLWIMTKLKEANQ